MSPPPGAPPTLTPEQRQANINAHAASAKAFASSITARVQALADQVTPAVSPEEKRISRLIAEAQQELEEMRAARARSMSSSARAPA
eukprot:120453-Karenia_brevis.AAC.1